MPLRLWLNLALPQTRFSPAAGIRSFVGAPGLLSVMAWLANDRPGSTVAPQQSTSRMAALRWSAYSVIGRIATLNSRESRDRFGRGALLHNELWPRIAGCGHHCVITTFGYIRQRGLVALRPRLRADLPLSQNRLSGARDSNQFRNAASMSKKTCVSRAHTDKSRVPKSGWQADHQAARTSGRANSVRPIARPAPDPAVVICHEEDETRRRRRKNPSRICFEFRLK